ncbi:zinc-dependent metalloprotease [Haloarcula onubensis]|uniref:Zinc-dependent metalloprotease n=1 Tax=Haloarcula onubensis TaxID=2950539 RepID=A0ABU2FR22_9EURY|nr:zinc-dependent metalloprotease [Halomicroarcula sp. S3CR25-11]MDS0283214.1 zinc-dependent metalloprotease [Halomicroarcula sp. S3CR25-11]
MGLYHSVRAVAGATGDGPIDWGAVADAAKGSTDPGDLTLSAAEEAGYTTDVRDARDRVREVSELDFDLPNTVEIQNRHHWIDANVATFERVMAPIEQQAEYIPGVARVVNTGSMAFALSFLGNNVLGQYDPLLLADNDDHALYFVRPNIQRVADQLGVEGDRFRRWIAFHEVTHAAEFGAAPWLSEHMEETMEETIEKLSSGELDRSSLGQLDTTMTAVEGYAELLMDRAFDDEYDDLRRKVDERRKGRGPIASLVRRFLGLGMKRQQYERGKAFFDEVADARGVAAAGRVWDSPETLPTDDEIETPRRWMQRVLD